jgi:phosphoribosylpyrophosphate synthetase
MISARTSAPEPLVFSTHAYTYLAREVAETGGWELGTVERRTFPDGEHYLRIGTDPADRDVILVAGTIDDASTLELYDLACGLVTGGAYRLRMVIPFFGYSTMERSVHIGEIVTAKTRARLLSSIPQASRGTQIFLLDLHVDALAYYFEGGVIYDDMIRTGGSLVQAARAYRDAGATAIDAIATHGLFPGESLATIRSTGLFGRIVTTDSHPRAALLRDDFLEVDGTARLLVEHLISNC